MNWCKIIPNILRYQMFLILIVNKWQRPPIWEGRRKRQSRGKESKKKRLITPSHEFSHLKHVYLYLWTNGCSWPCVLRKCRNSSTPNPHYQKSWLPLPSGGGSEEVHQPGSWGLGMPIPSPWYNQPEIKDLNISSSRGQTDNSLW